MGGGIGRQAPGCLIVIDGGFVVTTSTVLGIAVAASMVGSAATAAADTPNVFQPDKLSSEAMTTAFESCLPDGRKGAPGKPPRFEGRFCGCQVDWFAGHPSFLQSAVVERANTQDIVELTRKLSTRHPDFVPALNRCKQFARATQDTATVDKTPFTPPGEFAAEVLTKSFWSCFAVKLREGYVSLPAIRECGCLLDAARARRTDFEEVQAVCTALGRVAATGRE